MCPAYGGLSSGRIEGVLCRTEVASLPYALGIPPG